MKRILEGNPNTTEHWHKVVDDNGPGLTVIQTLRYQEIARYIRNVPCDVVDLGCGTGTCDSYLKIMRPLTRLTGVDYLELGTGMEVHFDMPEGGKFTQRLFENFVVGEVTNSGLPSGSYDYAISAETLEHLDEPQKLISEMYRLLRREGRAILTTPFRNRLPSGEHVWEFEIEDVEQMFKNAGFKKYWVTPYASGGRGLDGFGQTINPEGTWDEIWVLASKGGFI